MITVMSGNSSAKFGYCKLICDRESISNAASSLSKRFHSGRYCDDTSSYIFLEIYDNNFLEKTKYLFT